MDLWKPIVHVTSKISSKVRIYSYFSIAKVMEVRKTMPTVIYFWGKKNPPGWKTRKKFARLILAILHYLLRTRHSGHSWTLEQGMFSIAANWNPNLEPYSQRLPTLAVETAMLMLPGSILPTTACQELHILSNSYRVLYECILNKQRIKKGLFFK